MTIEAAYLCQRVPFKAAMPHPIVIERPVALVAPIAPFNGRYATLFDLSRKNQIFAKTAAQPAFVGISTPQTLIEFEYTVRNRKRKST
ncbi:MAG: hypothetical protein IPN53_13970 [Comamonadaceae bacterium]|nr:hypothetical protein [Comamonadaceae bacterium]